MKKLTLGARIKSLLPTLSISLPAVITGILIFTETNLIDPLTSLLSKTEDENKKEEDTEGEGKEDVEKDANGKEKSEKKGKGKGGKSKDGKGGGSGDSLDAKGDKDSKKEQIDGGGDENKDGSTGDGQESGKANIQIEGNRDEVAGSDSLNTVQSKEKGIAEENGQGAENGKSNQNGVDNDGESETSENTNLINPGETVGEAEERKPTIGKRKVRQMAPAFEVLFGGRIDEEW